ncbi:MAG: helix-turn-helix domain-containing protein [Pseudomonadota bacterium]
MKEANLLHRSNCPIATSLDFVGDKWTLVIVRDMLNGKSRFNDFLESPERITATVLTKRLEAMVKHELVVKKEYVSRPPRYQYLLTEKGQALSSIVLAFCEWGNAQFKQTWKTPEGFGVQQDIL